MLQLTEEGTALLNHFRHQQRQAFEYITRESLAGTDGSPTRSPRVTRDPHAAAQAMHDHVMLVGDVALLREEP